MAMGTAAWGQGATVAPTPPMGWNSWDAYGLTITEAQFRANVDVLRERLAPVGWKYAVIDEGWFFENPEERPTPEKLRYAIDGHGRYVPVPARFPSAGAGGQSGSGVAGAKLAATIEETSFVALGEWVHSQGLKFGIHIVRGIPRASVERNLPIDGSGFHATDVADQNDACPWDPTNWGVKNNAAGQAWYDSLLRQYAAWGVDLLKVDCIADHPYKVDEIRMIRRAIYRSKRPMVLSISPGPTNLSHATEVRGLANMWRISDDVWDVWATQDKGFPQTVTSQFARLAAWAQYAGPNHWPDADMLPLGELKPAPGWGVARTSRLTMEEQRTQLTLWAMGRSPLILGANLTMLDGRILRMLTNKDLVRIDQTSDGSHEAFHEGNVIGWISDLPEGEIAIAVFNVGDAPVDVHKKISAFGAHVGGDVWKVHDVWAGDDVGKRGDVAATVAPHGCALWVMKQ
jgi:alpha-galactosidase